MYECCCCDVFWQRPYTGTRRYLCPGGSSVRSVPCLRAGSRTWRSGPPNSTPLKTPTWRQWLMEIKCPKRVRGGTSPLPEPKLALNISSTFFSVMPTKNSTTTQKQIRYNNNCLIFHLKSTHLNKWLSEVLWTLNAWRRPKVRNSFVDTPKKEILKKKINKLTNIQYTIF